MTQDALRGDVRRLTLRLAVPSMLAMLFQGAGALCDALLLARRGSEASASVALSFPLLTLIQAVGCTLGMGAGASVSRKLGGGDAAGAADVASQGLVTAAALALALCVPAFALVRPLLALLAAGRDVAPEAAFYARCLLAAGPAMCMSLVLSALLRAQGMIAPNVCAFGLGALAGCGAMAGLMAAFPIGAQAAGVALLLREGVTLAVLAVWMRLRRPAVRPSLRPGKPRMALYGEIMRSGLPALLRQGLCAVSGAMLTRMSASFGADALAGMGLAVRAGALLSAGITGFGQGLAPVCGVCFGAGDLRRAQEAYRFCMRTLWRALCMVGLLTAALARRALLLFGAAAGAADVGAAALAVQALALPMQGAVALVGMLTQAMGMTARASLAGASRQGFVLIPLLMTLPRAFDLAGLVAAQGVSDVLSLALCLLLMRGVFATGIARGQSFSDQCPSAGSGADPGVTPYPSAKT